jgi:exodeoxyribonuclease V alpha subunit
MAVFLVGGQFAAFHVMALRGQIALAFALTVHKSQGSEFDRVALILPESDIPLLTREILYTAVTRSKRSVTIVGNPEVFKLGIKRTIKRFSGIAEKLRQPFS